MSSRLNRARPTVVLAYVILVITESKLEKEAQRACSTGEILGYSKGCKQRRFHVQKSKVAQDTPEGARGTEGINITSR